MKSKIMLVSVLTIMVITSQNLKAQFEYGIHAGMNLETQAKLGQLWNNCDFYQGYLLGGFVEYKPFKNISFQTELNYQKKGDKSVSTVEGVSSVTRREFNYLSVPLLLKTTIHDAEQRPAGADQPGGRIPVEQHPHPEQIPADSADKVQCQKTFRPQPRRNDCAEQIESPHIKEQMPEVPVYKHRGYKLPQL